MPRSVPSHWISLTFASAAIFCCLTTFRTFALDPQKAITQFTHRTWGAPEGLATVFNITQTKDGNLYLATGNGTLRFDGVKFSAVEQNPAEPPVLGHPYGVLGTQDGSLWSCRAACAMRSRDGHIKVYGTNEGLPGSVISLLCEGKNGVLWAATESGLVKFIGDRWEKIGTESGLPEGEIQTAMVDHSGTLWCVVASTNQESSRLIALLHQDETQFQVLGNVELNTARLAESPAGKIWAAQVRKSVRAFERGQAGIRFVPPEIRVGSEAILFDRDGTLWIATEGDGLRRARNFAALGTNDVAQFSDAVDKFTQKDGLSSDYLTCIFEDREGNVWFGSTAGLDCFSENKVTSLSVREGLPFDDSLLLQGTPDGCVWLASSPRGFAQIKQGGTECLDKAWFKGEYEDTGLVVYSLYQDPEGSLLLGTGEGVLVLQPDGNHAKLLLPKIGLTTVRAMTRDHEGALWICDQNKGIHRLKGSQLERMMEVDTSDPVMAAHTDRTGKVWLGFADGNVAGYDGSQFHMYSAQDGLFSGTIRAIFSDAQGQVWIAGRGGISRFLNGRFQTLTRRNGLPDESFFAVIEDDFGSFWLAGGSGLFRVAERELAKALDSTSGQVTGELIDLSDGLRGLIRGPSGWAGIAGATKSKDGKLWFATTKGLAILDPHHLPRNSLPPPVQIQQVIAAGKTNRYFGRLEFPIGTKNCEIDYAGLSFVNPAKVRYRYKLEGYDQEWVEAGARRQAFYSNLKPGAYKFRVRACNNDGVWNETGALAEFSIRPAFHEQIWFPFLFLFPAALLLWGLYRLRIARITVRMKLQLEAQDKERRRIAQELHDTLLQGFTGIGLKLDAIAGNLPESLSSVRDQLRKVLDQSDQYLTEARRAVWELRSASLEKTDDFPEALSESCARVLEGTGIQLNFSVEGERRQLAPDVESNLLRICEETAANAVKHARPTQVRVKLKFTSNEVELHIQDNGCGFNPQGPEASKTGHFGLIGIGERVKSMQGSLVLESGPGQGTAIVITVNVN